MDLPEAQTGKRCMKADLERSALLLEFVRCFPDIAGNIFEYPERLADFVIVLRIGPGPFEPPANILDGIGGKLKR